MEQPPWQGRHCQLTILVWSVDFHSLFFFLWLSYVFYFLDFVPLPIPPVVDAFISSLFNSPSLVLP